VMDYNVIVVLIGTSLLGAAGGCLGVFLLLRKRALLGDAIAHATLPGVCIAYLIGSNFGSEARNLLTLLGGALATGLLGALTIVSIRKFTPIKEDAAMGIVLSVYFGTGIALLRIVQQLPSGYASGIESFIFGKTASLTATDVALVSCLGLIVLLLTVTLRRPLTLVCFDSLHATSQGWSVFSIDLILMTSVTLLIIVGLQAVGMILMIAVLVIPAATARFWTNRLWTTVLISTLVGWLGALAGAAFSASVDKIPSGASIVLSYSMFFSVSVFFGTRGGLIERWRRRARQKRETEQQHFLRAVFEFLDAQGRRPLEFGQTKSEAFSLEDIKQNASAAARPLRAVARSCESQGLLVPTRDNSTAGSLENRWALTARGIQHAIRAVRQHRLLEIYFSKMAELSVEAIDRGADYSEHALDEEMLAKLERDISNLATQQDKPLDKIPDSLHPLPQKLG
jgi:manganese/zinc/iron transport system permease protein